MDSSISNAQSEHTTHERQKNNATNQSTAHSFEMEDETASRTPVAREPTRVSVSPIVDHLQRSEYSNPMRKSSQMLQVMQTIDDTQSVAQRLVARTVEVEQDPQGPLDSAQGGPHAQTLVLHHGNSGEPHAPIDPSIVSSDDTLHSSPDTSLTIPSAASSTYRNKWYPQAGTAFNTIAVDLSTEDVLNQLVHQVVTIDGLGTITKARMLKDALMTFYWERLHTWASHGAQLDEDEIVDICCSAIDRPNRGAGSKVVEIVRKIVAMLQPPQDPGKEGAPSCLPSDQKRSKPPTTSPFVPKRLRLQHSSSAAQSIADNGQEIGARRPESSVDRLSPPKRWKCEEVGCPQKKPFKDRKSFVTHYNAHFPFAVYVCLLQKPDGEPCHELWNRPDNLKSHLKVHGFSEPLPSFEVLENDRVIKSFQIHDRHNRICPWCKETRQLSGRKVSRDHIIDHYANRCAQDEFFDRCPERHLSWKCSLDIPEEFRYREADAEREEFVVPRLGVSRDQGTGHIDQAYLHPTTTIGNGGWHFGQTVGGQGPSSGDDFGVDQWCASRIPSARKARHSYPASSTTVSGASHGASEDGRMKPIPLLHTGTRQEAVDGVEARILREIAPAALPHEIPLQRYLADTQRYELIACGHATVEVEATTMKLRLMLARGGNDSSSSSLTLGGHSLKPFVSRCHL